MISTISATEPKRNARSRLAVLAVGTISSVAIASSAPMRPPSSEPNIRLKNAREFAYDLNRSLPLPVVSIAERGEVAVQARVFEALLSQLPSEGTMAELAPSIDGLYKLASHACERWSAASTSWMTRQLGPGQRPAMPVAFDTALRARLAQSPEFAPEETRAVAMQAAHVAYSALLGRRALAPEIEILTGALFVERDASNSNKQNLLRDAFYYACFSAATDLEFLTYPIGGGR